MLHTDTEYMTRREGRTQFTWSKFTFYLKSLPLLVAEVTSNIYFFQEATRSLLSWNVRFEFQQRKRRQEGQYLQNDQGCVASRNIMKYEMTTKKATKESSSEGASVTPPHSTKSMFSNSVGWNWKLTCTPISSLVHPYESICPRCLLRQ